MVIFVIALCLNVIAIEIEFRLDVSRELKAIGSAINIPDSNSFLNNISCGQINNGLIVCFGTKAFEPAAT